MASRWGRIGSTSQLTSPYWGMTSSSVLVRAHDSEYARCLCWVRWIFRAVLHFPVVVIDLREEPLSFDQETTKVVLAVWIVLLAEVVKGAHAVQHASLHAGLEGFNPLGNQDDATDERRPTAAT
jgi:hypothetical protein